MQTNHLPYLSYQHRMINLEMNRLGLLQRLCQIDRARLLLGNSNLNAEQKSWYGQFYFQDYQFVSLEIQKIMIWQWYLYNQQFSFKQPTIIIPVLNIPKKYENPAYDNILNQYQLVVEQLKKMAQTLSTEINSNKIFQKSFEFGMLLGQSEALHRSMLKLKDDPHLPKPSIVFVLNPVLSEYNMQMAQKLIHTTALMDLSQKGLVDLGFAYGFYQQNECKNGENWYKIAIDWSKHTYSFLLYMCEKIPKPLNYYRDTKKSIIPSVFQDPSFIVLKNTITFPLQNTDAINWKRVASILE